MANKRRPKKTKAPYRRYGPGVVAKHTQGHTPGSFDDEDEEEEEEVETNGVLKKKNDLDEVLNHSSMTSWPMSKFAKIDVLKFAIMNEKIKSGEIMRMELKFNDDLNEDVMKMYAFPAEIFQLILKFVDKLDPKFLRVCKLFYQLYCPILYHHPVLDSHNFLNFVDCVSSNKKKMGSLVKELDLSTIIQSGKNSYVSKLLRRCSDNLEVFVAPQTSFGYAPLISLRLCKQIKVLDLGLVSETVNLKELFHSIKNAKQLTKLSFPRSSISCEECDEEFWPPNLWYLRLSGGISNKFLAESKFPSTITRLEFAHCPQLKNIAIYNMLNKYGENLTHLSIQYPMPGLGESSMDFLFTYCPNLIFLQISVDYCSQMMFSEELLPRLHNNNNDDHLKRPLRTLWLESSGGLGQSSKIHPDDLTIAIMEDRLPCLKNVRITSKLGWDVEGDDVSVLVDLLEEKNGGLYINYY